MALIGYARVSTEDQDLRLQREALAQAGVAPIDLYTDTASGASSTRPGLDAALARVEVGDTLVAWRLDRLGRSVAHLAEVVRTLSDRGVTVRTISDGVDTGTSVGRFLAHLLVCVAEYEREMIRERVIAGVRSAQRNGTHCGRPRALTSERLATAAAGIAAGQTVRHVARAVGCSQRTLQRALAAERAEDDRDAEIARRRIGEIAGNPDSVIRGERLDERLRGWGNERAA